MGGDPAHQVEQILPKHGRIECKAYKLQKIPWDRKKVLIWSHYSGGFPIIERIRPWNDTDPIRDEIRNRWSEAEKYSPLRIRPSGKSWHLSSFHEWDNSLDGLYRAKWIRIGKLSPLLWRPSFITKLGSSVRA